jgi:hypothetical protein
MKETGSKSVEIPGSMGNHGGKIVCVERYPKRNEAGDVALYSDGLPARVEASRSGLK